MNDEVVDSIVKEFHDSYIAHSDRASADTMAIAKEYVMFILGRVKDPCLCLECRLDDGK